MNVESSMHCESRKRELRLEQYRGISSRLTIKDWYWECLKSTSYIIPSGNIYKILIFTLGIPLRRGVLDICDKSLSVTCGRSVVFSGYSGFLYQKNWPPWYHWNIVESGVKHHNPKPSPYFYHNLQNNFKMEYDVHFNYISILANILIF